MNWHWVNLYYGIINLGTKVRWRLGNKFRWFMGVVNTRTEKMGFTACSKLFLLYYLSLVYNAFPARKVHRVYPRERFLLFLPKCCTSNKAAFFLTLKIFFFVDILQNLIFSAGMKLSMLEAHYIFLYVHLSL